MQANNSPNQIPDGAAVIGPFTDLLYRVDDPADIAEVEEINGGFDLGQALSTSMGLSPVATAQSGPPAQPILPMLMPSTGQTMQTSSMTQMGVTVQLAPKTQMTPTTQMASMVLPAPTLQTGSTSQPIPTAQVIQQVLVDQSSQACSLLAEATFRDIDDMVNGIEREEAAEKTKKDEDERQILRLRGVVTQLRHRHLVHKGAKVVKIRAVQLKTKRAACFVNDLL